MVLEGWVSRLGVPIFEPHGGATRFPDRRSWNHWPDKAVHPKAVAARRVVLVEFDDVLFRTPLRPRWWPFLDYHGMVQSLQPPCVPAAVGHWFNPAVVDEVTRLQSDPTTWTLAHTFRSDAFRKRVGDMLSQAGLLFDSERFRPVCPCCSPLGLTYTGAAGYGRLAALLTEEPQRADDKHLLVILADVLNDCLQANEVLLFLSTTPTRPPVVPSSRSKGPVGESSSQYHRMRRLLGLDNPTAHSRTLKIEIRAVVASPCKAGEPTEQELASMTYWDAQKKALKRTSPRSKELLARRRAEAQQQQRRQLVRVQQRMTLSLEALFAPSRRRLRGWDYGEAGGKDAFAFGKQQLGRLAGESASAWAFDESSDADYSDEEESEEGAWGVDDQGVDDQGVDDHAWGMIEEGFEFMDLEDPGNGGKRKTERMLSRHRQRDIPSPPPAHDVWLWVQEDLHIDTSWDSGVFSSVSTEDESEWDESEWEVVVGDIRACQERPNAWAGVAQGSVGRWLSVAKRGMAAGGAGAERVHAQDSFSCSRSGTAGNGTGSGDGVADHIEPAAPQTYVTENLGIRPQGPALDIETTNGRGVGQQDCPDVEGRDGGRVPSERRITRTRAKKMKRERFAEWIAEARDTNLQAFVVPRDELPPPCLVDGLCSLGDRLWLKFSPAAGGMVLGGQGPHRDKALRDVPHPYLRALLRVCEEKVAKMAGGGTKARAGRRRGAAGKRTVAKETPRAAAPAEAAIERQMHDQWQYATEASLLRLAQAIKWSLRLAPASDP